MIALLQFSSSYAHGHGLRGADQALIITKRARQRVQRSGLKSLRVTFVLDKVRHVKANVRAFLKSGTGNRPRPELEQGLMQLWPIIGKLEGCLAGRRINRRSIGWWKRRQVVIGRGTHLDHVAAVQMNIVKDIG